MILDMLTYLLLQGHTNLALFKVTIRMDMAHTTSIQLLGESHHLTLTPTRLFLLLWLQLMQMLTSEGLVQLTVFLLLTIFDEQQHN